jgi:type VI protein secretion system component VasF
VDHLASDLKKLNKGAYDKLSVQWELPQGLMQRVTTLIPPWIFGVVASFIIFIIFIVLKSMVGSESATLISELKGILSKL